MLLHLLHKINYNSQHLQLIVCLNLSLKAAYSSPFDCVNPFIGASQNQSNGCHSQSQHCETVSVSTNASPPCSSAAKPAIQHHPSSTTFSLFWTLTLLYFFSRTTPSSSEEIALVSLVSIY